MAEGFGIDLGTTRTSIGMVTPVQPERGWYGNAQAIKIANTDVTPSVILFEPDSHTVGTAAKRSGHMAKSRAHLFKRNMGDASWRFHPESRPTESFSAEDLSSLMLEYVATQAERVTGLNVKDVVVTVPAYFGEPERRRTRCAAERAGLTVLDIINEPTAAVLAYLFAPGVARRDMSILVFDLGGGTLDTVVVNVVGDSVTIASIAGETLGGHDLDSTICNHLNELFDQQHPGCELPMADVTTATQLMLTVEEKREDLSDLTATHIPVWGSGTAAGMSLDVAFARKDLEDKLTHLIDESIRVAREALEQARAHGTEPTRVLFVGGTTKTPAIRERVIKEFGLGELTTGVEPDVMVTHGAAMWAQKLLLGGELTRALGVSTIDDVDWTVAATQQAINDLAARTGHPADMLARLLALDLRSITSRGYALKCQRSGGGGYYLEYLIRPGDRLPVTTRPKSFAWRSDTTAWELEIYEGDGNRDDVDGARRVAVVREAMATPKSKGHRFDVSLQMARDQIIHVLAWHGGAARSDERLDITIDPR